MTTHDNVLRIVPTTSIPRPKHPVIVEKHYASKLIPIAARVAEQVNMHILPIVEKYRAPSERVDSAEDDLRDNVVIQLGKLRVKFKHDFNNEWASSIASNAHDDVKVFALDALRPTFKKVGIDFFAANPAIVASRAAWIESNVNLISSLPEEYLGRVESLVEDAIKFGMRHETIAKQIMEEEGICARRAEFIARDQVAKLNGQITKQQHEEAGITHYMWSTARDDRVRKTHSQNEGQVFAWNGEPSPPASTGHPGVDYQCRCQAIPVTDPSDIARGRVIEEDIPGSLFGAKGSAGR